MRQALGKGMFVGAPIGGLMDISRGALPGGSWKFHRDADEPVEELTTREKEVLAQLGKGASNKEIAYALTITERTARTHVSNILGKLGLASRTQAALWAVEHKLIEPSGS
jgi:DNA-binding NarL/FixJ family response regulator